MLYGAVQSYKVEYIPQNTGALNYYDFDTCWCLKRVPIDIKCLYSRDICVWSESFETDGTSLVKKNFCLTIEHIT